MDAITITNVCYTTGSAADAATGLLGYLACTLDNGLRLDGLTLRRTLSGRLTVSFPSRVDGAGIRRAYVRPIDDEARQAFEAAVFAALGLQAQEAA